jgi:hypothetical protein
LKIQTKVSNHILIWFFKMKNLICPLGSFCSINFDCEHAVPHEKMKNCFADNLCGHCITLSKLRKIKLEKITKEKSRI